ncbi:hypothetical protein ES708_09811 [subsurface metagenome]
MSLEPKGETMVDTTETSQDLTLVQRMLSVFHNPRATFTSLTKSVSLADILVPFLLLLVLSMGAQTLMRPLAMEEQEQRILLQEDLSEEQKEVILDRMDTASRRMSGPVGYAIGLGTNIVWYLLLAGIIMFMGSFILGGQSSYKVTLAIVLFASLVGVVEMIVKTPLILQTQTLRIETGLDLLLPGSLDQTLVGRFFHRLDFFSMWKVYLMALGVAYAYKVSEKQSRIVLYGAWILTMFLLAWLVPGS